MKPKDPIWSFFNKVEENGKATAKCKTCDAKVSAKSDRLKNHVQKCKGPVIPCKTLPHKRPLEETSSTDASEHQCST